MENYGSVRCEKMIYLKNHSHARLWDCFILCSFANKSFLVLKIILNLRKKCNNLPGTVIQMFILQLYLTWFISLLRLNSIQVNKHYMKQHVA